MTEGDSMWLCGTALMAIGLVQLMIVYDTVLKFVICFLYAFVGMYFWIEGLSMNLRE